MNVTKGVLLLILRVGRWKAIVFSLGAAPVFTISAIYSPHVIFFTIMTFCIFMTESVAYITAFTFGKLHYYIPVHGNTWDEVQITSGPLWFGGPAQNYPYCYSDNSDAFSVIIFMISYSNNRL